MSLKRVFETLAALGLNRSDANVYVFLAKNGPHNGKDLCNALKMQKPQLYPCLKNLQNKQLVNATQQRPALFSAVPFETALELLIKTKMNEAKRTQQVMKEALTDWKQMTSNSDLTNS